MTNNVQTIETNFYRNLGDGVKAGGFLNELIRACVTARDTTILTKAIKRAEDKGDKAASSVVRFVVSQVWPGAKVAKSKAGVLSIKIKGIEADDLALGRLKEATDKGLSIRHSAFRKCIKPDTDTHEFDVQKYAKAVQSKITKEGQSLDVIIAALQALRSA